MFALAYLNRDSHTNKKIGKLNCVMFRRALLFSFNGLMCSSSALSSGCHHGFHLRSKQLSVLLPHRLHEQQRQQHRLHEQREGEAFPSPQYRVERGLRKLPVKLNKKTKKNGWMDRFLKMTVAMSPSVYAQS